MLALKNRPNVGHGLKKKFWTLVVAAATAAFATHIVVDEALAEQTSKEMIKPGPNIKRIDYDALFAMEEPPAYKPFEVYGIFLMSVAMQQTPLILDLSAPLPPSIEKKKDVVFKEVDGQQVAMDVYFDRNDDTPNPLILIIHGGYWKTGDKSIHQFNAVEFVEMGYSVASVNYRLSASTKFPGNIEDVYEAIRYLTANAAQYNIDPSRIATWGGSAGGHLSGFIGLAANTPDKSYNAGIDPTAIKAIISMYGMHDLTLPIQREHPFTIQYIGKTFEEAPEIYKEASPIDHADPSDPPVLLIHGSIDGSVSVQNSDALAARLDALGLSYEYDRVEGWPHAMDLFSPIGERSLWFVRRFLEQHMPSDEMVSGE